MQKKSFFAQLVSRNPLKSGLPFDCEAIKHCSASRDYEPEAAPVWRTWPIN